MTATEPRGLELGHRPALDGLRGIAVLLVLVGHVVEGRVAQAGVTGVTLFFVLSGFLITALLLQERDRTGQVNFGNFYVRRALRLFPAMAVFLAVVGTFAAVSGAYSAPVKWPALYLANVARADGNTLGLLGHTWSLSLEEQFYLLWPTILLLALRRGRIAAMVVAGLGVLLSWLATVWVAVSVDDPTSLFDRLSFGPDTRSYALFLGCLLALAWPYLRPVAARLHLLAWPSVLAFAVASFVPVSHWGIRFVVFIPLAAAATTHLLLDLVEIDSRLQRWLSDRRLVWCGKVSYGLYLWHLPIDLVAREEMADAPSVVRMAVVVVLAFGVTALSWRLVEQPFLRLKSRFQPARRVPATAPAPA